MDNYVKIHSSNFIFFNKQKGDKHHFILFFSDKAVYIVKTPSSVSGISPK